MSGAAKRIGGGILLVIAAAILWWVFRPADLAGEPAGAASKSAARSEGAGRSRPPSRGAASKLVRTLPEDGPPATHEVEELTDFIIPDFEVRDATLEEALAGLFDRYHQICSETGEQPLAFRYRIAGPPAGKISVTSSRSLLATLRVLAAFSGCDLVRDGTELTFTALPPDPDGPEVTRQYPVPATIEEDLLGFVGGGLVDPFANLTGQLRSMRLISGRSTADFLPVSSQLVLSGPAADQARFRALLDEVLLQPPVQFRSAQRIIESPVPLDLPGPREGGGGPALLSGPEFEAFIERLGDHPGAAVLAQPTVVARQGQAATVEMTKAYLPPATPAPDRGPPGPAGAGLFPVAPEPSWTGHKSTITANGYGFFNLASTIFESRSVLPAEGEADGLPGIERLVTPVGFTKAGTDWAVVHTLDGDTHRYLLFKVHRVAPDGTSPGP